MKFINTTNTRYNRLTNDLNKEERVRLHKIIAKLRSKEEKRVEGKKLITIIRVEKSPTPQSIMERSLTLPICYAMNLKIPSKVFCRLIKAKIRQELVRRSGKVLIL